jgi:hypothetical protein
MNEEKNYFQKWFESTNWNKRPNAICKPCWELKYCPYGPLVEDFPHGTPLEDDKICRIFGHECPVFSVAEPFTETKELRNISRDIPRPVQFRVLKRDNQICAVCSQNVRDADIEFDHIIPYSKGGHSDESNIRLLCSSCNRKRSNNYEDEFLVPSFHYHTHKQEDTVSVEFLIMGSAFIHDFISENSRRPSPQEMADELAEGELTTAEETAIFEFGRIEEFLNNKKPKSINEAQFEALILRWGFKDRKVYRIKEILTLTSINSDEYYSAERELLERLGYFFVNTAKIKKSWLKR